MRLGDRKIKIKVFAALCSHAVNIMDGWVPYPCTVIAQRLNTSVYQVRKAMKTLVSEGLAQRSSCVLDWEECALPYHGFTITDKGKKTAIFRYEARKEARICAECFGCQEDDFFWSLCGEWKDGDINE